MGEFIGVGAGVICILEDKIPVILDMEERWGGKNGEERRGYMEGKEGIESSAIPHRYQTTPYYLSRNNKYTNI
jgi:hypothetical protein